MSWRQDSLDRLGADAPAPDRRLSVTTTYVLAPGRISRTDEYRPTGLPIDLKNVRMEFGSFSSGPRVTGRQTVFAHGDVTGFKVLGLEGCANAGFANPADADTPTGPLASRIACQSGPARLTGALRVGWTLTYH